jgi:long-chain fatty acid transport protein
MKGLHSAALLLLSAASGSALASGFQLLENGASAMGTSNAGTAALAEDATTVFSNPAGMSLLADGRMHLAANLSAVQPAIRFASAGSTAPALQTSGSGNGGDAAGLAYIPSMHFVMLLDGSTRFGIAINVPFGLKTDYVPDWSGRFQGAKSDVRALNINPSLSWKASDAVAFGFGLNYQRLQGEFTSSANYAASVFAATGNGALAAAAGEGFGKISGSAGTWGYDLGAIFQASQATRIGISYRSALKYHLTGSAQFSRTGNGVVNAILDAPASSVRGGAAYCDIELPDTLTLSTLTHLDDKWDILADLAWTGWAKIPDLTFRYADNSSIVATTPENWRNTWRTAFGGVYRYNDKWKSRIGIAYDQTPVQDQYRTVRLPDSDRTWLSFGGQYRLDRDTSIDFAYSHLFMKRAPIDNDGGNAGGYGIVLGNYASNVNILGVQYSVAF